jgi:hypothetical protein
MGREGKMNTAPDWVDNKLTPILTATPGLKVLVVEGDDDEAVYRAALDKLARAKDILEGHVAIIAAGGKRAVLRGLAWLRDTDWWAARGVNPNNTAAIVDRDEWDRAMVTAQKRELPQLRVNEVRHCLESYFCDPDELKDALLGKNSAKYKAPLENLRKAVAEKRADWVPHWALWVTLHRASAKLALELEFPTAVLNEKPLPKDGAIKQQLQEWSKVLDVNSLFSEFDDRRKKATCARHSTQARGCVHGKDFFHQVVLPMLQECDATVAPKDWMIRLLEWWPRMPKDLETILDDLVV